MERILQSMPTLKAIVSGGRAIIENVGDYTDGTELELEIVENDEMSDEERARLHAAIEKSIEEYEAGLAVPAEELLAEMRAQLP